MIKKLLSASWLVCELTSRQGLVKTGSGIRLPLKFGAKVRNCIWLWCRTGVKVGAYGNDFPLYIALTISTILRGAVKINVSWYMIKLDFWPWLLLKNGSWAPASPPSDSPVTTGWFVRELCSKPLFMQLKLAYDKLSRRSARIINCSIEQLLQGRS